MKFDSSYNINDLIGRDTNIDLSKRKLLQLASAGLMLGLGRAVFSPLTSALAATGGDKMLIIYYSRTGNTKTAAELIKQRVTADLVELKTAHTYPTEYRATTDQAKKEQEANFRPQLVADPANLDPYQVIFLGYPNWWGTLPMAFFSFFEKHSFVGKTLVPFCTHEGSRLGRSVEDIRKACPQAKVLEGLAIRGPSAANAQGDIDKWLRKVGIMS